MPRLEMVLYSCHGAVQLYDQVAQRRMNYEFKYSTDASAIDASSRWADQVQSGLPPRPIQVDCEVERELRIYQ
jgi:hypothetical protein